MPAPTSTASGRSSGRCSRARASTTRPGRRISCACTSWRRCRASPRRSPCTSRCSSACSPRSRAIASRARPTSPPRLPSDSHPMSERHYLDLLAEVLERGARKSDRTGTGTLSVFGRQLRFALDKSFPLLTTKKLHLKSIIYELLWFLRGDTNVKWLRERGVTIWDEWADERGELGPVYGYQWRHWRTPDGREIDQIAQVISSLRKKPDSRRHIVSAWNPADVDKMALPPCHALFQFYVAEGRLSCQMYQRSADLFLGVPFYIASYALLTRMLAQLTGLKRGEFVLTLGDAHLYLNHLEQAREQLRRAPRPFPRMRVNPEVKDLAALRYEDFSLEGYDPHPAIRAPIAV